MALVSLAEEDAPYTPKTTYLGSISYPTLYGMTHLFSGKGLCTCTSLCGPLRQTPAFYPRKIPSWLAMSESMESHASSPWANLLTLRIGPRTTQICWLLADVRSLRYHRKLGVGPDNFFSNSIRTELPDTELEPNRTSNLEPRTEPNRYKTKPNSNFFYIFFAKNPDFLQKK